MDPHARRTEDAPRTSRKGSRVPLKKRRKTPIKRFPPPTRLSECYETASSTCHLQNLILQVSYGLVMHHLTPEDKLQPALFHKLPHLDIQNVSNEIPTLSKLWEGKDRTLTCLFRASVATVFHQSRKNSCSTAMNLRSTAADSCSVTVVYTLAA